MGRIDSLISLISWREDLHLPFLAVSCWFKHINWFYPSKRDIKKINVIVKPPWVYTYVLPLSPKKRSNKWSA